MVKAGKKFLKFFVKNSRNYQINVECSINCGFVCTDFSCTPSFYGGYSNESRRDDLPC